MSEPLTPFTLSPVSAPAAVHEISASRALAGRPLGEILVRTEGLTSEKLEEALAAQRGEQAGARLGDILVRIKALGPEAVLRALAIQLELPYLAHVDPAEASPDLAKKIPINF